MEINFNKIKFFLLDALIFLARNWTWILGLTIFIGLAWFISTCRQRSFEKKVERLDSNISEANFEIKVLSNQKDAQGNSVNQAAVNSGVAVNKLEQVKKSDINAKGNNYGDVRKRYCEEFKNDCPK